jgi:putative transposase
MQRIAQKKIYGKQKSGEVVRQLMEGELDTRVELIQKLIPLGLLHVQEQLQRDIEELAGARYSRGKGAKQYARWDSQGGYVYLGGQRVGIRSPRVQDRADGRIRYPQSYREFQQPREGDEVLLSRLLGGLAGRRYEESAKLVPEVLGLSASSVSRRFVAASSRKLKGFCSRSLADADLVAIFIDGKTFADDQMVVALGVDIKGRKIPLGFVQTATENARACKEFLKGLVARGLKSEQGLLFVIDGAKGLSKAIIEVFGGQGLICRCQWHKRENVLSYLPKSQQAGFRRKLQQAYEKPTYEQAKAALGHIAKELRLINESAVSSLNEGLEETLTLHRLGLFPQLGISFKTTNCIESLNSQVARLTRRVSRWTNSHQKHRWMATALLDIEPRLRKIKGFRYLPLLRLAIQKELELGEQTKKKGVAA